MQTTKRTILLLVLCITLPVIAVVVGYFATSKIKGYDTTRQAEGIKLVPVAPRSEYGKYAFSDVAILNNKVMWAIGYDGRYPQKLRRSNDNGSTWGAVVVPTDDWILRAVSFADADNGLAVGNHGLILNTSDGGQTWKRIKVPTQVDLNVVKFVTPQVAYIGGQIGIHAKKEKDIDGNGNVINKSIAEFELVILCTTDGGKSWRTCYEYKKTGEELQITKTIWQLAALSEKIAIAVIDGSHMMRTEDGGANWQVVTPIIKSGFHNVAFSRDGTGWAVGRGGGFYQSLDKGKTWQKFTGLPQNLSNQNWWSIEFVDTGLGMAVGDKGTLAITYDSGKTWSKVKTNISEDLRVLRLHGRSGLVLGSQKVYRVEGIF